MVKLAFVFPGQGAQRPGMGRELADNYAAAAEVFAAADKLAGYSLISLCFDGPAETLNNTIHAQTALLVTGLAIYKVLREQGLTPAIMAGLSLGEYTALTASGAITLEQALPLVQTRARLMQAAVPVGQGAMTAVMGLENEAVESACREQDGIVSVANYNCPGQVVISGETQAVQKTGELLKAAGGRVVPLAVSVPSHCRLMADAAREFKPHLDKIKWQEPAFGVVSNVNAQINKADTIGDLLEKQLYSPVLWEQSVRYMMDRADYFIEIGPGSTLSSLIKRIDKNRLLGQVEDIASLEKVMKKVKAIE